MWRRHGRRLNRVDSSLWVWLDFENVDKTGTYIQRSQSSPLKLYLGSKVPNDAFTLVSPHIRRTKSLAIYGNALPSVLGHFFYYALFDGDVSYSSYALIESAHICPGKIWQTSESSTSPLFKASKQLKCLTSLSLHLLHTVFLSYSIPPSSNAPPERTPPEAFHHSNVLWTALSSLASPSYSPGVSLISAFYFDADESPLLECLPQRSTNPSNLSGVTAINLHFGQDERFALFTGPKGSLRIRTWWRDLEYLSSSILDCGILHSLSSPILSTTQRLTISDYNHPRPNGVEECPVFQYLFSTNNLRTLILIDCSNLPFILALDPEQSRSGLVPRLNMEELVLYIKSRAQFHAEDLISMAKNRASRGAKLSSIMFIDVGELAQKKKVLKLRKHVTRVEYRVDDALPPWDDVPGEGGSEGSGFWG